MTSLRAVTENQIRAFLNVSDEEYAKLMAPGPQHMHSPKAYSDIDRFTAYLHEEKLRQARDPQKVIALFGDYDTDGVCASALGTAALSVFGFRVIAGIPTMEEGYGLNRRAVDRVQDMIRKKGYTLDLLITADNGIKAHDGVAYAAEQGITVLVTDHHPAGPLLPQGAKVCIDPWKKNDEYPFKYNSGATVLWKAMQQYAITYDPDKKELIDRLIVLAGLSNVADVMKITDENRYMVVAAMKELQKLRREFDYKQIADTPYPFYNTVFWGLHDIIQILQESKDEKRRQKGKNSQPLPSNEELISWYIGPMLNAPRRVHGTCLEAMSALMVPDHETRKSIIKRLVELNGLKTEFRDKVLEKIDPKTVDPVICVNTRHGISGLIAGQLSQNQEMPSIVFARRDDASDTIVYDDVPPEGTLTASARSTLICPLNLVIDEVNRQHPGMIEGGGHETAAGITIKAKDYPVLKTILPDICREIIRIRQTKAEPVAENKVTIRCLGGTLSVNFTRIMDGVLTEQTEFLDPKLFAADVSETYAFLESLRPYGEGFEANTAFELIVDKASLDTMHWNPTFWKTFKFNMYGVECLTFNETWADEVKAGLEKGERIEAQAVIKMNKFRGVVTPQFQLSPL